jgi:hypothetical protein
MNRVPDRVAAGGDQAGDLADLGAVAEFTVGVDRRNTVPGLADRDADWFGDRHPDGESGVDTAVAQSVDVGQELLGAAGGLGPDQGRDKTCGTERRRDRRVVLDTHPPMR